MGRDWLYKASGGVDGCLDGGKSPATATATKPMNRKKVKDRKTSSSGCMSVIFNLFDVQNHQFRFHHPSFMSESPVVTNHQHSLQGIEPPRSSLESPESAVNGASSSLSNVKEQTNLKIPVGRIQIKTKFTDELSSENSNSPSTKTPNLVARLMGLDLLPEYSSPRPSSSSAPANTHHQNRSLPTTPRISTASRRSTDIDYHHRLSLQIDKENCNSCKGRRRSVSEVIVSRQDDDLKSLKTQYAKQITNQVRERISRRLGTDITNTVSSPAICKDQRRDSNLVLIKSKPDESSQMANSPKLRLLDIKSNLNKPVSSSYSSSIIELKSKSQNPKVDKPVKDEKIKRIASERYDLRLKKKSTTSANHVLNVKNRTKVGFFKNQMTSSSSPARSSNLQVSLPSNLNSSYKGDGTHNLKAAPTATATAVTRRMIYKSVDDSLVEILKPYMKQKPDSCVMNGSDSIEKLCEKIGCFPAVLEDIDWLIGRSRRMLVATAFETETETEEMVKEMEREIVESLVHEIATETVEVAGKV